MKHAFPSRARLAVLAALALVAIPFAAAEPVWISANDLKPAQITAPAVFESFTLKASAEKGITVEAIDPVRTAEDGEIFNVRIKLNGSGTPDYRSIRFKASGGAMLKVYLNSSSKTDARVLKLADASGAVLAELAAPPDDGAKAGMVSFVLPAEGEYCVFSANSGINIYMVVLQ